MMTLTPKLRETRTKKRASHPHQFENLIRKLVDKLEQAEITMKLEETKIQKYNT